MNMTPDETTLAMWLDDELTGAELAVMDSWAVARPDQLAAREEVRRCKAALRSVFPSHLEPPSPEFFNARIARMIETQDARSAAAAGECRDGPSFWRNQAVWLMPAAAAAGMAVTFWLGVNLSGPDSERVAQDIPDVYVPESGVEARWVSPGEGLGGVIVLSGVTAIPDSTDFSQTVYLPLPREIDRTASQGEGAPSPAN